MRLPASFPALAALVGAALVCLAGAVFAVSRVETGSYRAVERELFMEGHEWAEVTVDGLRVTLMGVAPDEATRFQALTAAGRVVDESRVIDEMRVAAVEAIAAPRFSIEILRNDDGVSLIGLVPAAMDRAAIADEVARLTRGAEVADLLESADYAVPRGWAPALDYAFDVLGELPRSKISVAADRVEITSVAENAPARRLLEERLRRDAPAGIEVVLNISAPRPVITPFTLRLVIDETGPRFDACSAYSEAGRTKIVTAAQAAGMERAPNCVLGLGVPSPRWDEAVVAGIEALAELGGGTLTYSDADVSLIGLKTQNQGDFDRVVGALEAALPDVFSLTATKPEPPKPTDGIQAAPEFLATLSPEGLLQLRGRVSDERQRMAVTGFARARFPAAEVTPAVRLDEDLPDGWAVRVFAGLEALSSLSNGALIVQPDFLRIRGQSGRPDGNAEISRVLSAKLGEAANFEIDVDYVEALDPVLGIPTPEECLLSIQDILATKKITFEPGSADIDGASIASVDRIAEVMEECSDVPMEIAGYTDSQGREPMNLDLSQQRAEAVLAALQQRRVLTGNLTPKGYGEENPIADNGTEAGREANRRIEFTLIAVEEDGETAEDFQDSAAEEGGADAPEAGGETTSE